MSESVMPPIGLTSFQKELWIAHLARPEGHPGVFCGGRFLLSGHVDEDVARAALRLLIDHFPLLSATLHMESGGMPVFFPGVHPEAHFSVSDVSGEADPTQAALALCEAFVEEPFTPLGGPLAHFALVRTSANSAHFLLKTFHLVGTGLANLAQFSLFAEIYESLMAEKSIDLGPRPQWQESVDSDAAYAASARAVQDAAYWREAVRSLPKSRIFPPLPGRPDALGDSAFASHPLSADTMKHLIALHSATGVSPAVLLAATHALALRLLLGRHVPVTAMMGNGERKNPRLIQGYMLNLTPFLPDMRPSMTFAEAVQSVGAQIQRLRRHARGSTAAALRAQGQLRELTHLWDTNINYIDAVPAGNTYFTPQYFVPLCSRKEEILLGIYALRGITAEAPLRMIVQYSRNHFSPQGAARHVARMEAVLALAAAEPERTLADWPLLLEEERAQVLRWEQGGLSAVPACTIPALFQAVAEQHPHQPAVYGEDGTCRTYADVRRHAARLAKSLIRANVRPGEVVAVLARRHPALPECILGIMACGAVYLPVDPEYPAPRVAHMLTDSGARLLLALEKKDAEHVPFAHTRLLWDSAESDAAEDEGQNSAAETLPPPFPDLCSMSPAADANSPAYCIYTSGSTGLPKGVLVGHSSFINMIQAQREAFAISPADHVLQFASPSFDAALSEIFMALTAGACLYPVSRQTIDAPWDLRDYMTRHAVSVVTFPPSYLTLFKGENFPGLRVLLTAGEAPVADDARHYARQLAYFNAYGPTEASVCAALQRLNPQDSLCALIGRPLPNTQACILNEQGRRVPPGMAGELWLCGAGLALGYHNRPDLTAQRFCEPADLVGQRCYSTGDRALWTEDGRLLLLGRTDDQVKIRGHRVEPSEIAALLESHPQVAQAAVTPVPHGDNLTLAAFVTPQNAPDWAELRAWLARSLPSYMLPSSCTILAALPLTPAGKIDRQALTQQAQATQADLSQEHTLSATSLTDNEARLAPVYAAILGHAVTSAEQNFFFDGGDSIKAVELLHRMETEHGLRLNMRQFMADSSLRAVALHLHTETASQNTAQEATWLKEKKDHADAAHEGLAFTQGQMALWAQECTRTPSARYHMPLLMELSGAEDAALRLAEALRAALALQPLCTAMVSGPVDAPLFLPFRLPVPPCLRWPATSDSRASSEALNATLCGASFHEALSTFIHCPFRLEKESPVRLALLRRDDTHWLLVVVMHHLVGDATGLRAVLDDALHILQGHTLQELPRVSLLRAAAEAEQAFLSSPQYAQEKALWRERLFPLPASLLDGLGAMADRPRHLPGTGAQIVASLTPPAAKALRGAAQTAGSTLLGAMLGLLGDFLCCRAAQPHCLVAVPVGTREHASLTRVNGYFVNSVALRLCPHSSPAKAMRSGGAALREAAALSRLPMNLLAEALAPGETVLTEIFATHMDLSLPPLPQSCGLRATPRLPVLRAAKAALSFLLLSEGDSLRLAVEYDTAALHEEAAHALLTDWARHMTKALKLSETSIVPEKNNVSEATDTASAPAVADTSSVPCSVHSAHSACSAATDTASLPPVHLPSETIPPPQKPSDVESLLREAWAAVLGVVPTSEDQFFLSGGDSIKAIQMAGHIRRAGLPDFTPALCFERPVFADLCAALCASQAAARLVNAPDSPSSGIAAIAEGETFPLPPLHALWVARHPQHWQHFHMALPLRLHSGTDTARLHTAFMTLCQRHEALRLRFTADGCMCAKATPPLWLELHLPASSTTEEAFATAARRLFPALTQARHTEDGPLYGGVLLHKGEESYFLLAAHHFALDALSLDILRHELHTAVTGNRHVVPSIDADSTPIGAGTWARLLAERGVFASEDEAAAELALWQAQYAAAPATPLPPGDATLAARQRVRRTISRFVFDATRRGSGLPELLATLARALHATHSPPQLLMLETHGREDLLPGVDISRSVGWFTAAFPLAVAPQGQCPLLESATAFAAQLDALPLHGARYAFAAVKAPDLAERRPHMSLNYLGRLGEASAPAAGSSLDNTPEFEILPHLASPDALPGLLAPDFIPESPLDVLASTRADGGLELSVSFAPLLSEEKVSALLDAWCAALDALAQEFQGREALYADLARRCLCAPADITHFSMPDPAQQAMLWQMQIDREAGRADAHYVQQLTLTLRTAANSASHALHPDAIEKAWLTVLRRHEALRALFPHTPHGEFWCVTLKEPRSGLERLDLSHLPPAAQQTRRDAHVRALRETPFDLAQGPLLFLSLFRRRDSKGEYWELSFCFSHLLMDGWCLGILLRELLTLHATLASGRPVAEAGLPPAPSLTRLLAALDAKHPPDAVALRHWWTAQLAGHKPTGGICGLLARHLPLTDIQACPQQISTAAHDEDHAERILHLDPDISRALARAAADCAVTLPQFLQAAWAVLLGGGERRDVVFGLIHAGRSASVAGMEDVMGLFIRTLPVRVCWKADSPLSALAAHVRDSALQRAPHERDMLADIQTCHEAGSALFDHILVFENTPLHGIARQDDGSGGLYVEKVEGFERQPYALAVSVLPGESWSFRFTCHIPRLPLTHLEHLVDRWHSLLRRIAHSSPQKTPCAVLEDVTWPLQAAGGQKSQTESQTFRPYEREASIPDLFLRTARQCPQAPACLDKDGDLWSYAELAVMAARVAQALPPVSPGEAVAVNMPRGPLAVAAMLGVLMAGGCYMPLDIRSPAERIGKMFRASGCRYVIEGPHPGASLPDDTALPAPLLRLNAGQLLCGGAVSPLEQLPVTASGGEAPACILFTSGTTGTPKGVCVPHRAVLRLVCHKDFQGMGPNGRMAQTSSLAFDAATLEIWGPLLNGGAVVFISDNTLASPQALRLHIEKTGITDMWLTAGLFSTLAAEDPQTFLPLRRLYSGGDVMSPALAATVLTSCPNLSLYNGYGPTENTTFTTMHRVAFADMGADTGTRPVPLGRPIAHTRVYIAAEDGSLASPGEWGELCAAGDGLALGYCGDAEATARVFHLLPAAGERVYRTGDVARWRPDGLLEFAGRRDSQIKVRGFRVEIQEVENALLRLDGVRDAAVAVLEQDENKMLAAFVTGVNLAPEAALLDALRQYLPDYMLPVDILISDALPIDANGKRDRRELARRAQQSWQSRVQEQAAPQKSSLLDSKENKTLEEAVADIFGTVLGIPVSGATADFFRLGGQSLKAMRLLARLNENFGCALNLGDVMRLCTVGALAAHIGQCQKNAAQSPLREVPALSARAAHDADWPLSPAQAQIWFQQRMYPESPVYSVYSVSWVDGPLDTAALQRALYLLEERHEALRLRLPENTTGTAPRQHLAQPGELHLHVQDCRKARHPARTVARLVAQERARAFHFGPDAPLVRASCFLEGPQRAVFILCLHHCLCDGWSMELLHNDLSTAYGMALHGKDKVWPTAPPSYMRCLEERARLFAETEGQAALERWARRMDNLPEPLNLPTDRPRPAVRNFTGRVHVCRLSPDLTQSLHRYAAEQGVSLFPVLLALTGVFLSRHCATEDMVLGMPAACRERAEEQKVVGLLMNVLPLRLAVREQDNFAACVRHCAAVLREALSDAAVPLEALVQRMDVPRDAGRNPLFDVMLAYEERPWTETRPDTPLRLRPYAFSGRQSRLDMSLFFRDRAEGLELHWEYSTALFTPRSLRRMAARLQLLAQSCCQSPLPVSRLPLLPPDELHLLRGFNATAEHWDISGGIHARFAAQVLHTPKAPALRGAEGEILSYSQLDAASAELAAWLTEQGLRPGQAVGVCFPRSIGMMTAIFAILRAGGHYVPLIPDMPEERLRAMTEDMPLGTLLLTTGDKAPALAQAVAPARVRVLAMPQPMLDAQAAQSPSAKALPQIPPQIPDDALAYILFTSGSTGRPKGVMVEQSGVLNRIFWMQSRFPLGPEDVILQKTPVTFDVSVWELFWWSWCGASLALLAPGEERDPAAIVTAVQRHKITVMHFVPSMLRTFLEHCQRHPEEIPRLATLKRIFASGEALTPEAVKLCNSLLHTAHGTELHNLYGPTEATVDVTWQPCTPFSPEAARVPIGRPISNTAISIESRAGLLAPLGVAGELVIHGVQVARGYVNRPEITDKAFALDPATRERSYRTGDLARWAEEGVLEYLGRLDDQVKIRGFRIELGEVENALERCPGVLQAVVRVGSMGGMPALEAFLVPVHGQELSLPNLRSALEKRLPAYMHPSLWFVSQSIPLSASGKAQRKALTGQRLHTRSKAALTPPAATSAARNADTEKALFQLWRTVLPEAGPFDEQTSFFDAGGNSLLLVRLFDLMQQDWPGAFTLPKLFAAPTIAAQARLLRGDAEGRADSAELSSAQKAQDAPPRRHEKSGRIAIIGMALRLADYDDENALWSDLLTGADRIRPLPPQRQQEQQDMFEAAGLAEPHSKLAFKPAAYLDDITGFDPARFGMAPGDARRIDPEQRLFFSTALSALENAGYGGEALDNAPVGVFVGASPHWIFRQALSLSLPEEAEQGYIINVPSAITARLSYMHNWTGPAALVDTACSSVLVALHEACAALHRGECSLALAGGARVQPALLEGITPFAIESTGKCTRPFDAEADGVCAGEGGIVFVLRPLEDALAAGDAIHAVIVGSAVNQDGRSAGIAAPNPAAQASVIRAAAAAAGVTPDQLHFIEAHGTATALGDPVEVDGLRRAFADNPPAAPLPLGSVKANFGHLDAAAGGLGLLKAVLALRHGIVPPQPHFIRPNPRLDLVAASLRVPTQAEPLPAESRPWRGGVSSFGLSGINAHLIVEEAPPRSAHGSAHERAPWFCVPLSASSEEGLRRYVRHILAATDALSNSGPNSGQDGIASMVATLTLGRTHLPFRMAAVAQDMQTLRAALLRWLCAGGNTCAVRIVNQNVNVLHEHGQSGEESARRAAQAFTQGHTPVWPQHLACLRCHLPAAPLEPQTCWPNFSAHIPRTSHAQAMNLWPGQGVPTAQGWQHIVPLHDPHFWPVAEHCVAGLPTLVGMAFPVLAAAAARQQKDWHARPEACLVLEQIQWLRPLTTESAQASLNLRPEDEGFVAELAAGAQPESDSGAKKTSTAKWATVATARLRMAHQNEFPPALLPGPLSDFEQGLWSEENMEALSNPEGEGESLVHVSPRWHCRRAAWRTPDGRCTVARLQLPTGAQHDLARLPWHPALLDVAVSLALDGRLLVPAACTRMVLRDPLPAKAQQSFWARCQLRSASEDSTNHRALVADCTLYADDGRELAALTGVTFLAPRPPKARLHTLDWTPLPQLSPAVQTDPPAVQPILILGEEILPGAQKLPWPAEHTDKTAWDALLQSLLDQNIRHVLAVLPMAPSAEHSNTFLSDQIYGLFHSLLHSLSDLGNLRLTLVGSADTLPEHALALGALLSVRQEDPRLNALFVDVTEAPDLQAHAEALRHCLFVADQPWLRLDAAGQLHRPRLSAPLPPPVMRAEQNPIGCVVITGGLGGMALALAGQVSPQLGNSVALLHRGEFPPESAWDDANYDARTQERVAALRALRQHGVDVALYSCDVTNRTSLAKTLETVRRERGPLATVIHTAGLAGDSFLLRMSSHDFAAVTAPKLTGALLLDELSRGDNLRHFVLASSRTALAGAPGQSAYSAANAALDSLARRRAAQGLPALSLGWNTLADTGMAARAGQRQAFSLHPSQLGETLQAALATNAPYISLSMPGESLPDAESSTDGAPDGANGAALSAKAASTELPTVAQGLENAPIAEAVRVIMERVLGYEGRLTAEDDFYALGGDSLSAIRIATALNALLGVNMGLADVLAHSRLKDLAALIETRSASGADSSPKQAPRMDFYPVSREQLAVLRAVATSGPHKGYNLPHCLRLPQACTAAQARAALSALMARHEVLRTRFISPEQPEPRMEILDLAETEVLLPPALSEQHYASLDGIAALVQPFDLTCAPLWRAVLVHVDTPDAPPYKALFFDIHHALADAQGVGLLLHDLALLLAEEAPALPPPGLQQKDAAWQQSRTGEAELDAARRYWLNRYDGPLPRTELAGDYPRPAWHSYRGGHCSLTLPETDLALLNKLAAAQGLTPGSLLLALWALLIYANRANRADHENAADSGDIVMALAADARGPGFEATAGMFACLLPLRLHLHNNMSLQEALRHAHQSNTEAQSHKAFPLGSLLAERKPTVDPSRTTLAEVTFSYMNLGAAPDSPTRQNTAEVYAVPHDACKADLAIFMSHVPEGLCVALEYYADLFAPARMEALTRNFALLTRAVLATAHNVNVPVGELLSGLRVEELTPPSTQKPIQDAVSLKESTSLPSAASAAQTELLTQLTALWQRAFDLPEAGPDDNFYELGGHSLLAQRMVNEIQDMPDSPALTLRDLLTHPTPRTLAAWMTQSTEPKNTTETTQEAKTLPAPPFLPTTFEHGRYPLSHAQQRLYVLQRLREDDTAYNMTFVFRLRPTAPPLEPRRLCRALHALSQRQDVLRTRILEKDGHIWQEVDDAALPQCLCMEQALPWEDACAAALHAALVPFDPAHCMARLVLHPVAAADSPDSAHIAEEGGQCVVLGMHHLLGDGWSLQIFFAELMALYNSSGDPYTALADMSPLPVRYRHYAQWQQDRDWSAVAAYWQNALNPLPPPLALPFDAAPDARPTNGWANAWAHGQTGEDADAPGLAGLVTHMVAPDIAQRLRAFTEQRRMSLAPCLLSLLAALLARLCRQRDMLIGMGVSGRERSELEGLVGFFVNIVPIRVRLPESDSLDDLLDHVQASCLEALARQDYPFDLLVRQCAPAQAAQRGQQLVNVMFEYQRYDGVALGSSAKSALDEQSQLEYVDMDQWLPLAGDAAPPARYDLTLYAQDTPQGLLLRAEYDSARFTQNTVAQWLNLMESLMNKAAGAQAQNPPTSPGTSGEKP